MTLDLLWNLAKSGKDIEQNDSGKATGEKYRIISGFVIDFFVSLSLWESALQIVYVIFYTGLKLKHKFKYMRKWIKKNISIYNAKNRWSEKKIMVCLYIVLLYAQIKRKFILEHLFESSVTVDGYLIFPVCIYRHCFDPLLNS